MQSVKRESTVIYQGIPERFIGELDVITKRDCSLVNRLKEIYNSFTGRGCFDMSIQALKEELREKGTRGNVSYIALEKAYKKQDKNELKDILRERFLDDILNCDIEVMYEYIKDDMDKLKKLYSLAENNSKFISNVLML